MAISGAGAIERPGFESGPASHLGIGRADSGSRAPVCAADSEITTPVPSTPNRPRRPARAADEVVRVPAADVASSKTPFWGVTPSGPRLIPDRVTVAGSAAVLARL